MKKHVKQKWLKALRSGEYKQGRYQLVDENDNFCCLGVLCNLAPTSAGKWEEREVVYNDPVWHFVDKYGNARNMLLPRAVREWAELPSGDPGFFISKKYEKLSGLNDSGKTFEEIADIIERYL